MGTGKIPRLRSKLPDSWRSSLFRLNFSTGATFFVDSFFSVDLERDAPPVVSRSAFLAAAAFAAASAAAFLRASSSARFLAFSISISIKRSIWAFNCSAERFFFLISLCIPFCFFCKFAKRVWRSFSWISSLAFSTSPCFKRFCLACLVCSTSLFLAAICFCLRSISIPWRRWKFAYSCT